MSRDYKKSNVYTGRTGTFPYVEAPASNMDATQGSSDPTSNNAIPEPNAVIPTNHTRGTIIKGSISNTDFVDANTIDHGAYAGNA